MTEISKNLIILGSGCAGLTAAIYAARANMVPFVLDGHQPGGQLTTTSEVENFPGFPEGINGYELMCRMRKQAERFGAEFASDHIKSMQTGQDGITLNGFTKTYNTKALIIATGASPQMLNIPGELDYKGKGVSTCAICVGAFFRNREVAVVGGGDTALGEAMFLTRFCSKVYLIHRRDSFRASKFMCNRLSGYEKIQILWNTTIEEVLGNERHMTGLRTLHVVTQESNVLPCSALFVATGHRPNSDFAKGVIPMDEKGYFIPSAHDSCRSTMNGIFLAGDCSDSHYQQAVIAAGAGARAAIAAEQWLNAYTSSQNG
jgi:thioredoxin reductase (NADPH)